MEQFHGVVSSDWRTQKPELALTEVEQFHGVVSSDWRTQKPELALTEVEQFHGALDSGEAAGGVLRAPTREHDVGVIMAGGARATFAGRRV